MKNSFDMEGFDIEELARKNIYTAPKNFYNEMQDRVLAACSDKAAVPAKSARIFKLNWMYAAAAALLLLFGIAFFMRQNSGTTDVPQQTYALQDRPDVKQENDTENQRELSDEPKNEAFTLASTETPPNEDLTKPTERHLTSRNNTVENKVDDDKNVSAVNYSKEQLADQVLAGFSGNELADLSQNTEQDVYLDLYN